MMNPQTVTVRKQNHLGEPMLSWKGEVVANGPTFRLVSALFSGRDAVTVDKVIFRKGDRMLERYYTDRWYNVFEVKQDLSDQVKCWYINLSLPAQFTADSIIWQDLALDLVIYPDGNYRLLDEDEFNALQIEPSLRSRCLETVQEILAAPDLIAPGLVLRPDQKTDDLG